MARIVDSSNTLTSPAWAGDFLDREHLMPGGARLDYTQFNATDAVVVTTSAQAAAGATSISVTALSGAIPSGTILYFGETGELARLSAAAAAGATSLSVDAIPAQIESGDTATYAGTSGLVRVVSGTAVGRTYTERDASTGFGPAAAADDEIYLVAFDVTDADTNADVELYRHGSVVYENRLPVTMASLNSTVRTYLRTHYECTLGGN